jgi:hypothetical protein
MLTPSITVIARHALLSLLLWSSLVPIARGQELLCNIQIDARQVQGDKSIFDDMQQTLSRYMNFTRFSNDNFEAHERIRCNIQIIVNGRPTADYFTCTANIVAYRPVFNSTYETVLLNISDKNFNFTYVPMQQMQFVDNTYNDNLTALLNFYAFIILGFDYDSFGQGSGRPFFQRAQQLVDMASSGGNEAGWRSAEDIRNRYWLVENLVNSRYEGFHEMLYTYHRQGLDQMESNPDRGRPAIVEALKIMQDINQQNNLLYITRIFLDTKSNELIQVFRNGFVNDKQAFVEIMEDIDPSNMENYNKVLESN